MAGATNEAMLKADTVSIHMRIETMYLLILKIKKGQLEETYNQTVLCV